MCIFWISSFNLKWIRTTLLKLHHNKSCKCLSSKTIVFFSVAETWLTKNNSFLVSIAMPAPWQAQWQHPTVLDAFLVLIVLCAFNALYNWKITTKRYWSWSFYVLVCSYLFSRYFLGLSFEIFLLNVAIIS